MELLTSHARFQLEERVETRCPGNNDAIFGKIVERARLSALTLVPHEHPVGQPVQAAFCTQVVPAIQQHPDRYPDGTRGSDEIRLRRSEVHQRRDEHHVRCLLAHERFVHRIDRQLPLGQSEDLVETLDLRVWQSAQGLRDTFVVSLDAKFLAKLLDAALLQPGCVSHARLLVMDAVAQAAQQPGNIGPAIEPVRRATHDRQPW